MDEKKKQNSRDLIMALKDLDETERLQVQGVIAGIKLARQIALGVSNAGGSAITKAV